MYDFLNVIERDPEVQIKIKDMFDKYIRLLPNYQSKKRYDTSIQNDIPKNMVNLVATTIVDIDIKLKMKVCGIEYLESRIL